MSIWMQEIAGSPVETITPERFTAIRFFIVDWNRREEFSDLFFSENANYPGRSGIVVKQITFEPVSNSFFDNHAVSNALTTLGNSIWGKATVVYGNAEATHDQVVTNYVIGILEGHSSYGG